MKIYRTVFLFPTILIFLTVYTLYYSYYSTYPVYSAHSTHPVHSVYTATDSTSSSASETEKSVGSAVVEIGNAYHSRRFPAVLSAVKTATLSFTVGGPLIEVSLNAGDSVKKGDVLMRIDPRDFQHEVDSAQARLDAAKAQLLLMKAGARSEDIAILKAKLDSAQAQQAHALKEYKRALPLLNKKAITPSELDLMHCNLQTANAQIMSLDQELQKAKTGERQEEIAVKEAEISALTVNLEIARAALDDTNLRAPFDGIVAVQNVNNFEIVHPGTPVITIIDISKLNVTIWLPEREILLSHNTKIEGVVTFPNLPRKEFIARLKEGEAVANTQTRAWKVVFEMENPPETVLLPGMSALLSIRPQNPNENPQKIIFIPVSALCADSQGQYVWVFRSATQAEKRYIKTGRLRNSEKIEVLDGLTPGEKIVTSGSHFVKPDDVLREM
ncbi:MAG: efflux RND transporter periplasmic adaptor subunit [Planctomycetia bacterium]|nr:efflux RND transporter periplasmic adaptor subunit [Planctomycetia bacterium]